MSPTATVSQGLCGPHRMGVLPPRPSGHEGAAPAQSPASGPQWAHQNLKQTTRGCTHGASKAETVSGQSCGWEQPQLRVFSEARPAGWLKPIPTQTSEGGPVPQPLLKKGDAPAGMQHGAVPGGRHQAPGPLGNTCPGLRAAHWVLTGPTEATVLSPSVTVICGEEPGIHRQQ